VRCFGNKCGGAESHARGRREESLAGGLVGELMQAAETLYLIPSISVRTKPGQPNILAR
jgi:hypothetical protein